MEIRPDYYDEFECIASACLHNCCVGWEIDIDECSLEKYQSQTGVLKEKLEKNISLDTCAHFILSEDERCPFLNDKNLCELILQGGDGMLCEICKEHPRFYNDVYEATEKGLGICCEAAAKIILTKENPVKLISDTKKFPENDFFDKRNEIFNVLQNRKKPLNDRIDEILKLADSSTPINETDWISIYKSLERLDEGWDTMLDRIDYIKFEIPNGLEKPCEQLIHYFLYRHLSGAIEDFLFTERIRFAILSCFVITSLNKTKTVEEMLEIARMYSAEIEYSDENIDILLEKLQN